MNRVGTIPLTAIKNLPADVQAAIAVLEGPKPPPEFQTDGATHAPNWLWIPTDVWICTIGPAAIHDWCYDLACPDIPATEAGRAQSDMLLWRNLMAMGKGLSKEQLEVLRADADGFYYAVRAAADSHFKVQPSWLPGWKAER